MQMRKRYRAAAWLLLLACAGAAAPKQPASRPTTQSAGAAYNQKDIKMGMSEAEAKSALDKAGVKIVKRIERAANDGMPYVVLWLDDWRRVVIGRGAKVSSISRDTLPFKIPPEWQQDIKPWMSVADALTALEKSGVKVVERRKLGLDAEFLTLDDGRHVGFRDDQLYTIQKPQPATRPAK